MMMKLWVLLSVVGFCFHCGSLTPLTCETPAILKAAESALEKINANRQEGYIFALNRVHDVRLESNDTSGVVYNLIIDVLETKCHVISKKRVCPIRGVPGVPKYGSCEANIFVDSTEQNVVLNSYNCTIQAVPHSVIWHMCPDCPGNVDLNDSRVLMAAEVSLKKFNEISGHTNYFALLNVTSASMQWVSGAAYFVEFTIQETVCSRDTPGIDESQCKVMDCEFAHKGYCSASHYDRPMMPVRPPLPGGPPSPGQGPNIDAAKCEIFEPEAAKTEEVNHQREGAHSSDSDKEQEPADPSHKHEHEHKHMHPHEHHHGSTASHSVTKTRAPLGSVVLLPPPALPVPSRAPPSASGCPGKSIHDLHIRNFEI